MKRVKGVIVLDEFEDVGSDFDDEDWEAVDHDDRRTEKRTYSAALRGR